MILHYLKKQHQEKTLSLDRVFNRAVTQVIFSGRTKLHCRDIFVSLLSETSSHAYYILKKAVQQEIKQSIY